MNSVYGFSTEFHSQDPTTEECLRRKNSFGTPGGTRIPNLPIRNQKQGVGLRWYVAGNPCDVGSFDSHWFGSFPVVVRLFRVT